MTRTSEALTAADLMQRDVIVVYDDDTLRDAMDQMTENHVTGLPVVNSKSRCVGLISATDILNFEQEHGELHAADSQETAQFFNPETEQWETVRVGSLALEEFGDVKIADVMTRDLLSVEPKTPLREVAQRMVDGRVHRILVLSEGNRLQGIVTSFDFVRLYAEQR